MSLPRTMRFAAALICLFAGVCQTASSQVFHKSDANGNFVGLRLHQDTEFTSVRFSAAYSSFTTIATPLYFFVGASGLGVVGFTDSTSMAHKIGGGSWGSLSDSRLKKDIRDFEIGTKELLQIRPRSFMYNGASPLAPDNGRRHVGVVAQEVRTVLPFAVEPVEETLDGVPILGYDSSSLVYVLVNAVQDQAKQLRQLRMRAQVLKAITCKDYPNAEVCR